MNPGKRVYYFLSNPEDEATEIKKKKKWGSTLYLVRSNTVDSLLYSTTQEWETVYDKANEKPIFPSSALPCKKWDEKEKWAVRADVETGWRRSGEIKQKLDEIKQTPIMNEKSERNKHHFITK